MTTLSEIADLLAKIASNIKASDPRGRLGEEDTAWGLSISRLNLSLNLGDNSRVLDTALSMLCFKAPQVFDSVIEYEVKTIVSALSSSVVCRASRTEKEEVLQIGSFISSEVSLELIQACADVWMKLEGHGMLSQLLAYALLRVFVLTSSYQCLFPSVPSLDVKPVIGRCTAISNLLCHMPRDFFVKNGEIPSRLLLWYHDPLFLKQDVTMVLTEALERPFLFLNKEFQERVNWRSIIICLALSPTMFIETRALLHNWFLLTGLNSVLEFQTELVWLIMDIILRPSCWGLSVEVASNLPFSNAYFPFTHHLLRTFMGPISSKNLSHIVDLIDKFESCDDKHSDPNIVQTSLRIARVDHKSKWALAMNFPDWFLFASIQLFSEQSALGDLKAEEKMGMGPSNLHADAARYIAWILSPFSKTHHNAVFNCLTKLSHSWSLKCKKEETSHRKKLKRPRIRGKLEDNDFAEDKTRQTIISLLQELERLNIFGSCESKPTHSILFRRILLGLLMSDSGCINEDGCEVVLHYAATGGIISSPSELKTIKEAMAGACLVFNLIDISEKMSDSMVETGECKLDFACRLKGITSKYLVKCVVRLLEHETDGILSLKDLYARLVHRRCQGQDVLSFNGDLDVVMAALSLRASSS